MTRRMIDSSMWSNESFSCLPPCGRLLLIGMVNHADDQGRIKAHPAYLRSQIFPYDDMSTEEVAGWLQQIAANGTVLLYTVNGKQYAQMLNWWDYQAMAFAMPSRHPAPDGWQERIRYTTKGRKQLTYNWTNSTGIRIADTCGPDGKPPTDHMDVQVVDQVDDEVDVPLDDYKYKDNYKDKEEGGSRARMTELVEVDLVTSLNATATAPPPLISQNGKTEYLPGCPYPGKRTEQVTADVYMEQARRHGILPAEFSCRIELLATHTGQRSYIDAAEEDNGTLNSLKAGVIALHKLEVETADQFQTCAESFAEHNDWMSDPTPSVNQFIKHAGQAKDGALKKSPTAAKLKVNRDGFYDFANFKSYKAALAEHPDISGHCTVKGTLI